MESKVFILPGLNNSGPTHWQTLWEKAFRFIRINQTDWETPVCKDWIQTLDSTLQAYPQEKILLLAHSLACCTIAHWAVKYNRSIGGALLVGPSDVEAPGYPPGTTGFIPMPLTRLPFPSIVIGSSDDPYVTIERAGYFAEKWGSQFINLGALGHINAASGLGNWPAGLEYLIGLDSICKK